MDDFYTRKDVSKDTVELSITIPKDYFEKSYNLMLKDFAKDANVKGFRKGAVPTDLIDNGTKQALKLETFERLAPLYVSTAITKENLELIAPPEYKELPKLIDNLDVTFDVKVTVMPEFTMCNTKKIKVKKEDIKIEDKEIEEALKELKDTQKTESKDINDDWAKEIGKLIEEEGIDSLESLKDRIRKALKAQKEHMQLHQMQDEVLKQAIELSKITIPQGAIDYEASQRELSFRDEMKQRGVDVEDFLKNNNITIDKMIELWKQDAKDALESDTLLNVYAKSKNITVTDEDLNSKIESIKKSQPNADPSIFNNPEWKEYIRRVETKEKAFRELIKEVLGEEFLDSHN